MAFARRKPCRAFAIRAHPSGPDQVSESYVRPTSERGYRDFCREMRVRLGGGDGRLRRRQPFRRQVHGHRSSDADSAFHHQRAAMQFRQQLG